MWLIGIIACAAFCAKLQVQSVVWSHRPRCGLELFAADSVDVEDRLADRYAMSRY
jgi:hypothetical protein